LPIITTQNTITTMLIDLDETVYPASSGLWPVLRERMDHYLSERMGFDPQEVSELRERLFNNYGTTMRGLQQEFTVKADDFLEYVHDVPLEQYLKPDAALKAALSVYPQDKYIFTNASHQHAERILKLMGLSGCFKGIIDIMDIAPWCKPNPEAYQVAMRITAEGDPQRILMVDDRVENLMAARELGIAVVLVGDEPVDGIPSIQILAEIGKVFK